VDEIKGIGPIKSMGVSDIRVQKADRVLICGGEKGEIYILRSK